jgi:hypothetical protein
MALATALAVGLAGCGGPIAAWRSLSGLDKNDPDPAVAPFTANIDKAETGGYPNLASVPPPPIMTSTAADRQKLAENLAAQGVSAQAPDARGVPGTPTSGPVPPPPPIPPALAASHLVTAPPPPAPEQKPTQLPTRRMDEPPVPGSLASTQQPPAIQGLPGVEAPRPPAREGRMSAIPQPAPSNLPPAAVQSGNPQPAPPLAVLPPAQPSPEAAARPAPKLPPVATTVAALDMPVGTAALGPDTRVPIAQVIAQYQQKPQTVRIVSYAAPAIGSAEQLNSFRAALDRAQIVAKQLTDGGIPAAKIQTEAAPSSAAKPAGRIEVQTLP